MKPSSKTPELYFCHQPWLNRAVSTGPVGATRNKDDGEKPVVVMEVPGECSVSVVRGVVQGKHPLRGRTVDGEHRGQT